MVLHLIGDYHSTCLFLLKRASCSLTSKQPAHLIFDSLLGPSYRPVSFAMQGIIRLFQRKQQTTRVEYSCL
ncbi:hypothetical protein Y032_0180g815 [Ancylostoma ceylanicum]|uniref:Uncharacterized protein n=1 Tax=Ancylostoma ceylanicum TaxID=53326 RepID=A0A016STC8_9BILA|nr:hypothetical protein Y032_0180g815 [Ancylostoma ceylanicum]